LISYQVKLIQFPNNKAKESVVENEDGSYTIFINNSLCYEQQVEAYNHAMKHLLGDDFSKYNINKIELDAHSA
jgi:hypothetical protein